ncbi:VRR-NUC domain-containing protein [Adhaeribacter radiodurans]|uniref:VRR-NUC domain-containing protein n=1 Tax=Adhaeribacter radiodurans TaxID=2745197 RepID=A0A7L7LBC4_9BACT|nr:VRR-NUC domain-containing protein [Adhaeribacter radiodurans]QMU30131.1 VRR-NUC domain-containing protein [Adhaeribacter radiodurans]
MEALNELSRLALKRKRQQYPSVPDKGLVTPKYGDKNANELTKAILDYFRLNGGYAVRINSQGQYNEKLGKFTKGTTTKGTADIHGCLDGIHYSIEIKIGADKQSDFQKATQEQVQAAGGYYYIATNFQSFYDWIITKKKGGVAC